MHTLFTNSISIKKLQRALTLILSFLCFTISGQNFIYVSDAGNFDSPPWQIVRYDMDGENPVLFIDQDFYDEEGLGWPQDILFLEDRDEVLVSNLIGNKITIHDPATGEYLGDFATITGQPTRMKIGPDDLIYVLQWSTSINKVLRYQKDGTFVDEFTSIGVSTSIGLDWDTSGNLYVSSFGESTIRKFDTEGNDQGIFINTHLDGPTNIVFEADGNLLVLNWSGGTVERFGPDGNWLETVTTAVSQPEGIALLSNGNILVGNGGFSRVDQFQSDGTFVESTIPGGSGGLIQPNAVVLRDISVSVKKNVDQEKILVTPSVGYIFKINTSFLQQTDSVRIYNLDGEQVGAIARNQDYWDASYLLEGLYLVVIESGEQCFYQKIIVNK